MSEHMANSLSPRSSFYNSQRLRLHRLEWGDPKAPPVLLIHGGMDNSHSWDAIAAALAQDRRVIVPDLRGHGDSQWSSGGDYSFPAHVYDIASLTQQLDLGPIPVVGHSMGGNVALRYAALFPDRVTRVVAMEGLGPQPQLGQDGKPLDALARMAKWIAHNRRVAAQPRRGFSSLEEVEARLVENNRRLSSSQAAHLARYAVLQDDNGKYVWKFDDFVRPWHPVDLTKDELQAVWHSIECSVLLMGGDESWHPDPRTDGRADHFRDVQIEMFAGAGHWVQHDSFDAVLASITTFLDSH